ncbi:MAG: hypothetical protein HZB95_12285 [Nitrosomonadales bacterium]|nr:hypothetical protein [Nitrosomonadales bacterium]
MKKRILLAALMTAFATAAQADGVGVYVNGGTTGFGLGLAGGSNSLGGRLVYDTWKRKFDQTDSNGNYQVDLKLQTVSALLDWYPFEGAFRTTLGLVANGNKATLNATSISGTYTFNGQTYTATDVGSYTGEVKFNSTAPYLGIGWGNPAGKDKTWGLTSDIGVLFQGAPKVTSTVTCGAALTAPQCAQLQSDVAAGATQLETDLKNYKYYPVISIGISYRF